MNCDAKVTKSNWACLGYGLLGVALLPTLPVFLAVMAVAWPVLLVVGIVYLLANASK